MLSFTVLTHLCMSCCAMKPPGFCRHLVLDLPPATEDLNQNLPLLGSMGLNYIFPLGPHAALSWGVLRMVHRVTTAHGNALISMV